MQVRTNKPRPEGHLVQACQTCGALSSVPDDADDENIARLLAMLRLVKEFRGAQGKQYSLEFVLATATIATLAGAKNFRELGSRIAETPQILLAKLGAPYDYFQKRYLAPSPSTLREILKGIDPDVLDLVVGAWLNERATRDHNGDLVIAIDGKVLRGAWTAENQQFTLLSAMIHELGVVVAQSQVPADTNEITEMRNLVTKLIFKRGRIIITADAAHTQIKTAILLWKLGIAYVLTVKGNQPTLHRQIFERLLPLLQESPHHLVEERSRGYIKRWSTWTTDAEGIRFPRARTIAVIRREEFDLEGNRLTKEYAFIVSSLRGERATAEAIHTHVRNHWGIENKVHHVRDVTLGEDACQAHVGNGPRNLAILRNLALGLLRLNEVTKIKETVEDIHTNRYLAIKYLAT
jgi:predicted transposase YbfD/YdcC